MEKLNAKQKRLLSDIEDLVERINHVIGRDYKLNKKGATYHIETTPETCLNGHWSAEMLERMYDQTYGFVQLLENLDVYVPNMVDLCDGWKSVWMRSK